MMSAAWGVGRLIEALETLIRLGRVSHRRVFALLRRLQRTLSSLLVLLDLREFLLDMTGEGEFGNTLSGERNFRCPGSLRARTKQGDPDGLPWARNRRRGGSRLVAAMRHTVCAFLVFAGSVRVPIRRFHQLAEALRVTFAQQVTGLLPAENVTRRHAPRLTVIGLVTSQKVQIETRMHESPFFPLAQAEHFSE